MSFRLFHLAPYRALLRLPDAARLVTSGVIGRMPVGMAGISIVLLVQEATRSYAVAGTVAGTFSVTCAVGAPLQGRLIDRFGQGPVLVPAATTFAAAFSGLAVAASLRAPLPLLYLLAVLSGLAMPTLSAALRTLWGVIIERAQAAAGLAPASPTAPAGGAVPGAAVPEGAVPEGARPGTSAAVPAGRPAARHDQAVPTLQTAYGFESSVTEVIFIVGPSVVAFMVQFASPAFAMFLGAALALGGALVFTSAPTSRDWRPVPRGRGERRWPLRVAGIRLLMAVTALLGLAVGMIELSAIAFADESGTRGAAGILLALWSSGSLVGGLWFGSRQWAGGLDRRFLLLVWAVALCMVPTSLAGSVPLMAVALVVNGVCFAPMLGTLYLVIDRLAPKGSVTETFTWIATGLISGLAGGSALGGAVIERLGVRAAFVTAVGVATAGAVVAWLGRRHLAGVGGPERRAKLRTPQPEM